MHAESSTRTMVEALFRPSNRYRDSNRNRRGRGRLPGDYTEVELLPGLTMEDVLATGATWDVGGLSSICSAKNRVYVAWSLYLSFSKRAKVVFKKCP
jgi:hypothetical protein